MWILYHFPLFSDANISFQTNLDKYTLKWRRNKKKKKDSSLKYVINEEISELRTNLDRIT